MLLFWNALVRGLGARVQGSSPSVVSFMLACDTVKECYEPNDRCLRARYGNLRCCCAQIRPRRVSGRDRCSECRKVAWRRITAERRWGEDEGISVRCG